MRRRFEPFDPEVIKREFFALPVDDAITLKVAMKSFQMDLGTGYRVKAYGGGLMMLTDSGRGQGRCLFFKRLAGRAGSEERLRVLLIYKKETRRVPSHILDTAKSRMAADEGQ